MAADKAWEDTGVNRVASLEMKAETDDRSNGGPAAVLVGIELGRDGKGRLQEQLRELADLARAAGAKPVNVFWQERDAIDPAFYIGRGKVQEIASWIESAHVEMAIFDDELPPNQLRNLEQALRCRVLDRTLLVLDIFASRARTSEGKLQVELAQLSYLLPRLSGKGTALSRLGGGIGTRGPGEAKLEMDRRRIRQRISLLKRDLEAVSRRRSLHRETRRDIPAASVALVGYTNAGKSTLFNALTLAGTLESPQLFATLDPLVRAISLGDGRLALLSDTVGFLRKLPHQLVAAFRATLEEVVYADLLVHVVDGSSEHYLEHLGAVQTVLQELKCLDKAMIHVFNKIDLLEAPVAERMRREAERFSDSVLVSAVEGQGLQELRSLVRDRLPDRRLRLRLRIPYAEQRLRSLLHESGHVVSEMFEETAIRMEVLIEPSLADKVQAYLVEGAAKPGSTVQLTN